MGSVHVHDSHEERGVAYKHPSNASGRRAKNNYCCEGCLRCVTRRNTMADEEEDLQTTEKKKKKCNEEELENQSNWRKMFRGVF